MTCALAYVIFLLYLCAEFAQRLSPRQKRSHWTELNQLAPSDPLVLSYYGTCLFYAPKPFGSKQEALQWIERAEQLFRAPRWKDCWVRAANTMYIGQCKEKLK